MALLPIDLPIYGPLPKTWYRRSLVVNAVALYSPHLLNTPSSAPRDYMEADCADSSPTTSSASPYLPVTLRFIATYIGLPFSVFTFIYCSVASYTFFLISLPSRELYLFFMQDVVWVALHAPSCRHYTTFAYHLPHSAPHPLPDFACMDFPW